MIRQLKIGQRSIISFGLLGLIALGLGLTAILQFNRIGQVVDTLTEMRVPAATTVGELRRDFLLTRLHTLNAIYSQNEQGRRAAYDQLDSLQENFTSNLRLIENYIESDDGRRLLAEVANSRNEYDALHRQLMTMIRAGDIQQAVQFRYQGFGDLGTRVTNALNQLGSYQQERSAAAGSEAKSTIYAANSLMVIVIIVALVLVVVLALLFSNSLIQPIRRALQASATIAGGDLTSQFNDTARDEMGEMIRGLAQMQAQLRDTILAINDSSTQLASTAEELSAVTEESTRIVHKQSDELEQSATAVNEMTVAVDEVARNAAATSQNSEMAEEKATLGRSKVNHTVNTVVELEHEITHTREGVEQLARRVGDISSVLDVIRGIAEQTNLLALNAAIEAARAGETGRGFAVVADEVRALAHRTQESTKEIESMMHAIQSDTSSTVQAMATSSQKAERTRQIAQEAGEALEQIAAAVVQINEQNQTIASAAEEQSSVAREVDRSLVNIRDLSVQTASGANQTSAASSELARLAEQLNQLVQKFRI